MNKTLPAVVFGLFETGLAVIRALGRKGIKVIGVDHKKDIAWYSRYTQPFICPHPIEAEHEFMSWIVNTFSKGQQLPVFFTGDDFLYTFSRNRIFFSDFFLFNLPEHQKLTAIADKYHQFQLAQKAGINVPQTWLIENTSHLTPDLFPESTWPLILKGREVNAWREVFGGTIKGFRINTYAELIKACEPALKKQVPLVAQEVIAGPDTNHYKYCAYRSQTGETFAEFCLQKIRQNPIRFGIGSVVRSVENKELINTGRKFFKGIDYQGIGSAEFKYDQKDGKLKLIELNPRYWQQNTLAETCGINFPLINYRDLAGIKQAAIPSNYKTGVKWINIYMDLKSFLDYKREGEITLRQWINSLKGPKVLSDFAKDDIIPGFWEIRFGKKLIKLPKVFRSNPQNKTSHKKPTLKIKPHV
jgi:predicted ATP-grasp superfamily ATP-dependent carboligase